MKQGIIKIFLGVAVLASVVGIFLFATHYMLVPGKVTVIYSDDYKQGQEDIKKASVNTSQGNGARRKESVNEEKGMITLSFFGDLMLDRSVRQHIERKGIDSIFAKSEELFGKADFNIANLEGPVADFESKSVNTTEEQPGHFSFVFDPKTLPALQYRNLSIMNLGNNHILNFGKEGLQQTKNNLTKNLIQYFGDPENNNYLLAEKNGVKVALLSYNEFRKDSAVDVKNQLSEIQAKVDLVIVYAHWGAEYENQPNESQKNLAHQFIDAGADAVIGSHPHVTQSIEQYKGKYIFYSLGNFLFDQFFSPEVKKGLNVVMHYDKDTAAVEYTLVPITINGSFELQVMQGEALNSELQRIAELSLGDEGLKTKIRSGNWQ